MDDGLVKVDQAAEPTRMTSGEALAEILDLVRTLKAQQDQFLDLASTLVDQIQELAAGGVGGLIGSLLNGGNGDSEHRPH